MIPWLVVAVLAGVGLFYVFQVSRRAEEHKVSQGETLADELDARKRAALVAIVDLEDEHEVGKLSNTDLNSLRATYEAEALDALRELDALRDSTFDDDELEIEIAAMREQLKCPNCGSVRSPGQKCERCDA